MTIDVTLQFNQSTISSRLKRDLMTVLHIGGLCVILVVHS